MDFKVKSGNDPRTPVAYVSDGALYMQFHGQGSEADQKNCILGGKWTHKRHTVQTNGTGSVASNIKHTRGAIPIYEGDTVEITF